LSLRGDLREFGLHDLLSLAFATRKSGTLTVRSASSTVESLFHEGRLADVRVDGATSIFQDASPETAIERALQVFERMVIWSEGSFAFDTVSNAPAPASSLDLELAPVVERVRARQQEWQRLQSEWPDLNASIAWGRTARARSEAITLQPSEWGTVTLLCEQPSLQRLATELALDAFEVRRVADQLTSTGVAERRFASTVGNVASETQVESPSAPTTVAASGSPEPAAARPGAFTGPSGPERR
jgi:hypothetical protein